MQLYIEEEGDIRLPLDVEKLATVAVLGVLSASGCPYETEVNLLLTEDAQIQELNLEYRKIDRATDVLSFPMIDYERPGVFPLPEEKSWLFHPETGTLLLGDIVLSKERVLEQAKEFGHSVEREYAFFNRPFYVTLNRLRPYGRSAEAGYGRNAEADHGEITDFTLSEEVLHGDTEEK